MIGSLLLLSFIMAALCQGPIAFYDSTPSFSFEEVSSKTLAWGPWDICPTGEVVKQYSYWFTSETGSTGMRLQCGNGPMFATSSYGDIRVGTQKSDVCTSGFNGAKIMYSTTFGIAEIDMKCSDDQQLKSIVNTAGTEVVNPQNSPEKQCSVNHTICGIRTQMHPTNGLMGLEFLCCQNTSSFVNDQQQLCNFETDECGYTQESTYQETLVSGQTFVRNMFKRAQDIPFRSIARSGPENGTDGTDFFVYYESSADSVQSNLYKNTTVKRKYKSPENGGILWRNVQADVNFYAWGYYLGELYFQVYDSNDNLIQESQLFQPLYNIEGDIAISYFESKEEWRKVTYPLYVNGTTFKTAYEVRNGPPNRQGDFGLDQLAFKYHKAGTCSDKTTCHQNATCYDLPHTIIGFRCECKPGFLGAGQNVTDGCVAINPCADDPNLCMPNGTDNLCVFVEPGNYTCQCNDAGYSATADKKSCYDIDECSIAGWCGGDNTTCSNTPVGNYTCGCQSGYTKIVDYAHGYPLRNLTCDLAGGWTAWSEPGGAYPCSKTCQGGIYNATRNCTNPAPEGKGALCDGPSINETAACNVFDCPASCAVWKNCSACENYTAFIPNGPLNSSLTYFDGVSSNDLTYAMTALSYWNQTVIEEICESASCNVAKLNSSIDMLAANNTKIGNLVTYVSKARLQMRDILDCNPDSLTGHNEWLWDIFDTLCGFEAFLPHIHEDLTIKLGMLVAERNRCMNRTPIRKILELMYRKW